MKTIIKSYTAYAIVSLFACLGCKKQIEIDPPVTIQVTSNVFSSDASATSAVLSIYSQISSLPYLFHSYTGYSSDELYTYYTDNLTQNLYKNRLIATNGNDLGGLWINIYQYMYQVNSALENIQSSNSLSPKVKKQLLGETQFLRAYFYFYLTSFYGNVPLALTTDYHVTSRLARAPQSQVYQQIVADLQNAQGNLSNIFVNQTDTIQTVDRIRPTVWAADALLARTYLYLGNGNYDKAEAEATKVINNSALFGIPPDLNSVFKKNSNEAIFQIATYSGTNLSFTSDGVNFVLSGAPSTTNLAGNTTISSRLMAEFEPGDLRQTKWIGTYSNGSSLWNYPAKYKDNSKTAATTSEYTMILRLAEQYLIRAEARAELGNISGALEDLNAIRHRAGLSDYSGATDLNSLLFAISHERQVELFAEGDRWFDLRRTGQINKVMGIVTPLKATGLQWDPTQALYPIPPSDILLDNNLVQNPGY